MTPPIAADSSRQSPRPCTLVPESGVAVVRPSARGAIRSARYRGGCPLRLHRQCIGLSDYLTTLQLLMCVPCCPALVLRCPTSRRRAQARSLPPPRQPVKFRFRSISLASSAAATSCALHSSSDPPTGCAHTHEFTHGCSAQELHSTTSRLPRQIHTHVIFDEYWLAAFCDAKPVQKVW